MSYNRDRILCAAVRAVYGHGFANTIGDLSEHPYGYTMATVSPVLLRNVGELTIADDLESIGITRDTEVITLDRDNGDHEVYKVGDRYKVGQAFDALEAAHLEAFPDTLTCRHCADVIRQDDNGAGGTVWVHEHGSTVCHDVPAGSLATGTTAEPVQA